MLSGPKNFNASSIGAVSTAPTEDKKTFRCLVGTGGVGSGSFFELEGDHTLGREESRAGRFLDRQDYCKLHIITHYVKALLGGSFQVIPASLVGQDDVGSRLLGEMEQAGLDTRYLSVTSQAPTLFSFCFLYPDGSGGNLTTSNSAASLVDAAFIDRLQPEFERNKGVGIALAVPEVPLPARQRLLELGTEYAFFRAASFTDLEAASSEVLPLLQNCDLLALNLGEAAALASNPCTSGLQEAGALAGAPSADRPAEGILQALLARLEGWGCHPWLSITGGKQGSWLWDGVQWLYQPAIPVQIANTAGAGDAHFAGLLAGIAAGLPLPSAHELAGLTAALKVTSPHTLHKGIQLAILLEFAHQQSLHLSPESGIFLERNA
jgi:sugar/nucleoside kinase (ribokinase family)